MPDMERMTRDLEKYLAKDDPVRLARVNGKHAGEDRARWEIVAVVSFLVIVTCLICAVMR